MCRWFVCVKQEAAYELRISDWSSDVCSSDLGRRTDALKLPFGLTGAQERVGREIAGDMAQDVPMLRMLQGDVGSGKTLVALRAMLAAVEAGTQAALLAPTEILARQHHATLQAMLAGLPVNLAIITGRRSE